MKKIIINIFLLALFIFPNGANSEDRILNVAVASNLTYVMPSIIKAFEKEHHGIRVRLSLASTGSLYSLIKNGAPFDIFLSADEKRPVLLYKEGLTSGEPFTYARGRLILWSSKEGVFKEGLKSLASPEFKKIAIANPRHAPYGEAAREVLEKAGLWKLLQDKLIYGENITQTAQFVQSGSAQAGFVAESLLHNPAMKGGSSYPISDENYKAIMQRGVLLKRGNESSKLFKEFLFSQTAKDIFQKFGYEVD